MSPFLDRLEADFLNDTGFGLSILAPYLGILAKSSMNTFASGLKNLNNFPSENFVPIFPLPDTIEIFLLNLLFNAIREDSFTISFSLSIVPFRLKLILFVFLAFFIRFLP